jgi:hypothetical protein
MESQARLEQGVAELRSLLSQHSTRSVAGWCFGPIVAAQQESSDRKLLSPDRQISFLLSLVVSTPEPDIPAGLSEEDWRRAVVLLNNVYSAYLDLYLPKDSEQVSNLTDEWRHQREVSMSAFLHYFNSGLVASIEQLTERIEAYVGPFDSDLRQLIGLSSKQATEIARYLTTRLQDDLDGVSEMVRSGESERQAMIDHIENYDPGSEDIPIAEWSKPWEEKAQWIFSSVERLGIVRFRELERKFPTVARAYWEQFTIGRGDGPGIQYPTEGSVIDTRPLIRLDDNTAFCHAANGLFSSILLAAEDALARGELKARFLRARDKALEREVAKHARALLGQGATIWEHVYETPDGHFEHDVVAVDGNLCLIFEAKASARNEPLRDPAKAYVRLRDAFRSGTGIQKAYEQGSRIVKRLKAGEFVTLYDSKGREVGQLRPDISDFAACVCVTRDDFGPLATNLALLLDKHQGDDYPWAVSSIDLSTLAEAWGYFNWGSRELRNYLKQRLHLHGRVYSAYELDYAGAFIVHGRMPNPPREGMIMQLEVGYSDVFDDIYRAIYYGAPAVRIAPKRPVLTDLRLSLRVGRPVFVQTQSRLAKVGRNEPCPCGSGRKYKRCCER